jgi:hypothetical protein
MRRITITAVGALLAMSWSSAGRAQTSAATWIQASALYVVPGGDDFSKTRAGAGAEVQLRLNTPLLPGEGAISIGAGLQYSAHKVGFSNPLHVSGAFVEPRYAFVFGGSFLYLSARVAILRQSLASDGVSASASGTQMNVGGGMLVPVSSRTNLDFGATFGALRFGDFGVTYSGGAGFTGGALSGTNLVLRAGLAVALGGS